MQTDAELILKDRKDSIVSNTDSDLMLSADDHLNAFSNEDKTRNSLKEDVLVNEQNTNANEIETPDKKEESSGQDGTNNENQPISFHNKSINDIVPNENLEELQNLYINELNEKKKQNRIELLDYLLSFFETDKSLNYVLVGYVSRYFNNLLNKNPHRIISYIYLERPEILLKLIHHCSMKSIAEFLPKLFLIEPYLNEKGLERSKDSNNSAFSTPLTLNIELILAKRKTLLSHLFKALVVEEKDIEKISNISTVCIELLESKVVLETITHEKDILNHMMTNLAKRTENNFEINYNWAEIANVVLYIVRYAVVENLKAPIYASHHEDTVNNEFPKIENTILGESILESIERILIHFSPDNDNTNIDGTFGGVLKPLGTKKLKLIELVYFFMAYFKNVSSVINRILIKNNFLKNAIDYFFIYEWNNLYGIAFEKLFESYLNNNLNHPEITRHIFGELKLITLFCEKGTTYNEGENDGFCFSSSRRINHGFFALLIKLCYKIHETADVHFRENYFTPAWESFYKDKVTYWNNLFHRRLCQPEVLQNIEIDHHVLEDTKEKIDTDVESKDADNVEEENKEDNNPFQRDEYFFNMGSGGDDWYNTKKGEDHFNSSPALEEDINSFEFVEESKDRFHGRKLSQEEIILKEQE